MNETQLMNEIQIEISKTKKSLVFRNNVGTAKTIDGRYIKFGLVKGSSDLIGLTQVEVTPKMVGETLAVFTALEVKTPTGRATREQLNFIKMVTRLGGIGKIVRSVADALAAISRK